MIGLEMRRNLDPRKYLVGDAVGAGRTLSEHKHPVSTFVHGAAP
jgi:hypothetical protein